MKATIDRETCTGCGFCPDTCPDVFALDEEGLAYTLVDDIPAENEEEAQEAADGCPVEAITIEP